MLDQNDVTQLDLLRHGKLATSGVFCAEAEAPLSAEGMQSLIKTTDGGGWDVIISSPHRRCRAFAERLSKQRQCQLQLDDHFREMNFGRWTGIPTDTLWKQEAKSFQQLWQAPNTFIAPDGEAMQDFIFRVNEGLRRILKAHKGDSILLVTHAGVIRSLLAKALDMSYQSALRLNIDYAQMSRLRYYADGECSLYGHGITSITSIRSVE